MVYIYFGQLKFHEHKYHVVVFDDISGISG